MPEDKNPNIGTPNQNSPIQGRQSAYYDQQQYVYANSTIGQSNDLATRGYTNSSIYRFASVVSIIFALLNLIFLLTLMGYVVGFVGSGSVPSSISEAVFLGMMAFIALVSGVFCAGKANRTATDFGMKILSFLSKIVLIATYLVSLLIFVMLIV